MPQLQESRQAKIWMHALISTHTGVFWKVRNAGCFKSLLSSLAYSEVCSSRSDKRLERGHVWCVLALPIKWRFRKNLQINKPLPPVWLLGLTFSSFEATKARVWREVQSPPPQRGLRDYLHQKCQYCMGPDVASSCAWQAESTNEDQLLPQMAPHRTKKAMDNHTLYEFGHSEN